MAVLPPPVFIQPEPILEYELEPEAPLPVPETFHWAADEEPTDLEEPEVAEETTAEEHPLQRLGALGWEVEIEEEWTNQLLDESEAA
jgi:hypothetical protein